ncbi:MAG: hypothetical protein JWP81_4608 [Ferruginibacter sp.]|nr:hypothetical protein [Ferruginibacter sp.]
MKNTTATILPVLFLTCILTSGCEAIGSIFKAGMWTGIIGVIFVFLIIIFIVVKLFSRNKNG